MKLTFPIFLLLLVSCAAKDKVPSRTFSISDLKFPYIDDSLYGPNVMRGVEAGFTINNPGYIPDDDVFAKLDIEKFRKREILNREPRIEHAMYFDTGGHLVESRSFQVMICRITEPIRQLELPERKWIDQKEKLLYCLRPCYDSLLKDTIVSWASVQRFDDSGRIKSRYVISTSVRGNFGRPPVVTYSRYYTVYTYRNSLLAGCTNYEMPEVLSKNWSGDFLKSENAAKYYYTGTHLDSIVTRSNGKEGRKSVNIFDENTQPVEMRIDDTLVWYYRYIYY